jgi:hypothetical protein
MIRPVFLRGLFTVAASVSFLLFVAYLFMWCLSRVNPYAGSLQHGEYIEVAWGLVDGWSEDDPPPYILISLGFSCFCYGILPTLWLCATVRHSALSPPGPRPVARGFPVVCAHDDACFALLTRDDFS